MSPSRSPRRSRPVTEIDRLRVDNDALLAENQRLTTENARLDEIRRENESLTALLQIQAGLDFKTTSATVIARESSEFRRLVVLDRGTNDGIAVGDVADRRRRGAGRPGHRRSGPIAPRSSS